jgi:hypothetical protein
VGRVQEDGAIAWVQVVPRAASASRCGVVSCAWPRCPTASARVVSRETRSRLRVPAEGAPSKRGRLHQTRSAPPGSALSSRALAPSGMSKTRSCQSAPSAFRTGTRRLVSEPPARTVRVAARRRGMRPRRRAVADRETRFDPFGIPNDSVEPGSGPRRAARRPPAIQGEASRISLCRRHRDESCSPGACPTGAASLNSRAFNTFAHRGPGP